MATEISLGISNRTFIAGLIIAILASSALSTVIVMQWVSGPQGPKGDKGDVGDTGPEGTAGTDGVDGIDGIDGKSAYQIWLDQGNSGTEQDFIDSLKGEQGPAGVFTIENMSGWLPAPAWDSGWTDANLSHYPVFWHGLNTSNVLIHIQSNGTQYIQISRFTENEIWLERDTPDLYTKFRVMIWKISEEP